MENQNVWKSGAQMQKAESMGELLILVGSELWARVRVERHKFNKQMRMRTEEV